MGLEIQYEFGSQFACYGLCGLSGKFPFQNLCFAVLFKACAYGVFGFLSDDGLITCSF
jgi:hypothetical protein